jgi:phosphoribosylformylglycinamidine synthase subunit PurL
VYWQFVNAIKGMGEACRRFETPVTGGNVSFYNQSTIQGETVPVYPTPTIGMLGMMDDVTLHTTMDFKQAGDLIYLIGESRNDLGSSEYTQSILNINHSPCPHFDLETEAHLQKTILHLIEKEWLFSAHDVSEGGLFTTVLESAMVNDLGFEITADSDFRTDAYWFGESQSRVVVSVDAETYEAFEANLWDAQIPFRFLGKVTSGNIALDATDFGNISDFKTPYNAAIGAVMN